MFQYFRAAKVKIFIPLIFYTLLSSHSEAFSQSEPPSKANLINLTFDKNKTQLFDFVVMSLVKDGYSIEFHDRELGIVTSTEKSQRGTDVAVKLNFIIEDQKVRVNGVYKLLLASKRDTSFDVPSFERIFYGGSGYNSGRDGWKEMQRFSKVLKPLAKEYLIEE